MYVKWALGAALKYSRCSTTCNYYIPYIFVLNEKEYCNVRITANYFSIVVAHVDELLKSAEGVCTSMLLLDMNTYYSIYIEYIYIHVILLYICVHVIAHDTYLFLFYISHNSNSRPFYLSYPRKIPS